MSGPRMGMSQMNGNNRRPPNINRMNSNDSSNNRDRGDRGGIGAAAALPLSIGAAAATGGPSAPLSATNTQHDDLIKYIYDSWSKVESGSNSGSVNYYQEQENHLKDFQPFDLDAYYERRLIQNEQQPQHS